MRMLLSLLTLVTAVSSAAVFAQEPACVRAYRKAHDSYLNDGILGLTRKQTEVYGGAAAAAGAFGACFWKTRSWLACTTLVGGVGVVAYLYGNQINSEMTQLEHAYIFFNAYDDLKHGEAKSEDVQKFHSFIGTPKDLERDVADELILRMESGELCRSGKPAVNADQFKKQVLK